MGLYDFSLYDLINRNAVCHAGKPAWFESATGATITFDQFKQQVDRLAAGLQRAGIQAGDRIGIVGQNSLAFFELIGAAAASGSHCGRRSTGACPQNEVAFNLNDCTPKMVFADNEFAPLKSIPEVAQSTALCRSIRQSHRYSGPLDAFDQLMTG